MVFGHSCTYLSRYVFKLTHFSLPYQDEVLLELKRWKFAFNFTKIGHYLSEWDAIKNRTLVAQQDLLLTMMVNMDAYPSLDYKQLP